MVNIIHHPMTETLSDIGRNIYHRAGDLLGHGIQFVKNIPAHMQADRRIATTIFVAGNALAFSIINTAADALDKKLEGHGFPAQPGERRAEYTSVQRRYKNIFLNVVVVGGSVLTFNIVLSQITRYPLSRNILVAITATAVALRYFLQSAASKIVSKPVLPQDRPPTNFNNFNNNTPLNPTQTQFVVFEKFEEADTQNNPPMNQTSKENIDTRIEQEVQKRRRQAELNLVKEREQKQAIITETRHHLIEQDQQKNKPISLESTVAKLENRQEETELVQQTQETATTSNTLDAQDEEIEASITTHTQIEVVENDLTEITSTTLDAQDEEDKASITTHTQVEVVEDDLTETTSTTTLDAQDESQESSNFSDKKKRFSS